MDDGEQFVMITGIYWMPMLYAINLDLAVLSELTHMVEAHQFPSGWMKYSVPLETVTCLSAITMAGEMRTVDILRMLVLSAMD